MKKKKYMLFTCTALMYMLSSCISEFEATGLKELGSILVVEGIILEEGTKITLSRVVHLNENTKNFLFENVNSATIHIIDEANNVIAVVEQTNNWGEYVVKEKISFVPGMKYALDIKVFLKHYQSAFVEPVNTPAIDSVSWKLNDDNSIDIMVSTHASDNKTLYCFWDFKEDWEIRSRYRTYLRYDPITQTVIPQSLTGDNRYYCWASDYSKSLLLGSSEKLTNAVIKDQKIHTLQPGDTRYSYLYSITVNQYVLEREASVYFNNLQRNIEDSGSLFAPQPSEMKGNIKCISNPEEAVVGYIFASKPTSFRLYIPMAELNLNDFEDRARCEQTSDFRSLDEALRFGYEIFSEINSGQYNYITRSCVDCMARGIMGNTQKAKPDFWPNEHR